MAQVFPVRWILSQVGSRQVRSLLFFSFNSLSLVFALSFSSFSSFFLSCFFCFFFRPWNPKRMIFQANIDIWRNQREGKSRPCVMANRLKVFLDAYTLRSHRRIQYRKTSIPINSLFNPEDRIKEYEEKEKPSSSFARRNSNVSNLIRVSFNSARVSFNSACVSSNWRPGPSLFGQRTDFGDMTFSSSFGS